SRVPRLVARSGNAAHPRPAGGTRTDDARAHARLVVPRRRRPRPARPGRRLRRALLLRRDHDLSLTRCRAAPGAARHREVVAWSRGSALLDRRDVELEGHLLADEDPAGLERRVPGEAPVLAVDLGRA